MTKKKVPLAILRTKGQYGDSILLTEDKGDWIKITPKKGHIHFKCGYHPKGGKLCSILKQLTPIQKQKEGCATKELSQQEIENLVVEIAKRLTISRAAGYQPEEDDMKGKFKDKEAELRAMVQQLEAKEEAKPQEDKRGELRELIVSKKGWNNKETRAVLETLGEHQLKMVAEDLGLLQKGERREFFKPSNSKAVTSTGEEVNNKEADRVVSVEDNPGKEHVMKDIGTVVQDERLIRIKPKGLLEFEQVNASEMATFTGYQVWPVWKEEVVESGKKVQVLANVQIVTGPIKMPIHSPKVPYVRRGDMVVCRIFLHGAENREFALKALMDKIEEITIAKYGKPKVIVTSKPGESTKLIYFAAKEVWDEFFSCDIYKIDVPKADGYNAPTQFKFIGKDEPLKLLVIGKKYFKRDILDGNIHLNRAMNRLDFKNKKKLEAGEYAGIRDISAMQIRVIERENNPLIAKGLLVTDASGDMIRSVGLNPEKYDGATFDHNIKASRSPIGHLDTITIKASDIRGINEHKDSSKSHIGVQGTCTDPVQYRNLIAELNQMEKAVIWRKAVMGDLDALDQVIGELDPDKSYEDADIIKLKVFAGAIKNKEGIYVAPEYAGIRNTLANRRADYWGNKVLKMRVAPVTFYSLKVPVILFYNPFVSDNAMTLVQAAKKFGVPFKDGIIDFNSKEYEELIKPYADDALSIYEKIQFKKTGILKNYIIFSRYEKVRVDGKRQSIYRYAEQFKTMSAYRNPVVGKGSMQDNEICPADFATWLQKLGFKSIHKTKDGKYSCHMIPETCMTSQDQAEAKFEDNDGDFTYLLFSNTASFGVHRPVNPPEPAKVKEATPTTEKELNDLNRVKYISSMRAAAVTGMLDLTVRSIIEYYRVNGYEVSQEKNYWMAWVREYLAIKGIKHTNIDLDTPTENIWDMVKNVMLGDSELPPAYMVPETALKHPRVGRGVGNTTSNRMILDIIRQLDAFKDSQAKLREKLIKLKEQGKLTQEEMDRWVSTRDPYTDVFKAAMGASYGAPREQDSQYWKEQFVKLWNRIASGEKVLPDGWALGPKTIGEIANFGNKMVKMYSSETRAYIAMNEDLRRAKFTELRGWFYEEMSAFLRKIHPENYAARDAVRYALTVYLGKVGFGWTPGARSGAGGFFWYCDAEAILWASGLVHPDNPWIDKLQSMAKKR